MFAIERLEATLNLLQKNKTVRVKELAKMFNVSQVTIRKDLTSLEKENLIIKTHGGAILAEHENSTQIPSNGSKEKNITQLNSLAECLYNYIQPGDTIFLGSGTTCTAVANYITAEDNISVITNNIDAVKTLNHKCTTLILIGGEVFFHENHTFTATNNISDYLIPYNISKAITSCASIDLESGISVSNEASKHIFNAVLSIANTWFLIVGSEKFSRISPYKISEITQPEYIFTDNVLPQYKSLENIVDISKI